MPAYLDYRKNTQQRAHNTLRNDRVSVAILIRAVGDIDPRNIRPGHSDAVAFELSDGKTAGTFNTRLAGINAFMLWCRRRGHVGRDHDPLAELCYRKNPKADRERLPQGKFFELLDASTHARDRIICAMGLWLFLRASEMRLLKIRDLDLENGELHVYIQKTSEYDIMPISSYLAGELRRWLTFYTQNIGGSHCGHEGCGPLCGDWYLIPSRSSWGERRDHHTGHFLVNPNDHLLPEVAFGRNAQLSVQRNLQRVGFRTHMEGTHTLRRSGARAYFDSLVDSGFDGALKRVSSMLHHASVTMTERYLGIREDRHTRNRDIKAGVMFPGIETTSNTVVPIRSKVG